jgi:catechol 2,3-dioxygenase-like lactoylglutathione lyase family enzyme
MGKPKIRHLALFARKPRELADFYVRNFDMELVRSSPGGGQFLTDGYFSLAILPHKLEAEAAVGLNHFGFMVEDIAAVSEKLAQDGLEEARARPSNRPYAEFRACDPEGNQFDLSERGFQEVQSGAERAKQKEPVGR